MRGQRRKTRKNSVKFGKNAKNRLKIKEKAEILAQENFFKWDQLKRGTLTPLWFNVLKFHFVAHFHLFWLFPDETYSENCISCLTNLGELAIYSIPRLKKQTGYHALHEANKNGILSLIFTSRGEGFYLLSPSEFERLVPDGFLLYEIMEVLCNQLCFWHLVLYIGGGGGRILLALTIRVWKVSARRVSVIWNNEISV